MWGSVAKRATMSGFQPTEELTGVNLLCACTIVITILCISLCTSLYHWVVSTTVMLVLLACGYTTGKSVPLLCQCHCLVVIPLSREYLCYVGTKAMPASLPISHWAVSSPDSAPGQRCTEHPASRPVKDDYQRACLGSDVNYLANKDNMFLHISANT